MTGSAGRFTYAVGVVWRFCLALRPGALKSGHIIYFYMTFLSLLFSFFHCGAIADSGRADFGILLRMHTRVQSFENKVASFWSLLGNGRW